MRTVRTVAPLLGRFVYLIPLLFFGIWGVVLPFLFAAMSADAELNPIDRLRTGTANMEDMIRALWHLAILFPAFMSAILFSIRAETFKSRLTWTLPNLRESYLRFETSVWILTALAIATLHFIALGAANVVAAFGLALLIFVVLHPSRRNPALDILPKAFGVLILVALLKPSWMSAVLQWQPLPAGLFFLAAAWYMYSPSQFSASVRETITGGEEGDIAVVAASAPKKWSAADAAAHVGPTWTKVLWGTGPLSWARGATYESRMFGTHLRRVSVLYLVIWALFFSLTSAVTTVVTLANLAGRVPVQLRLASRYPAARQTLADAHFIVGLVNIAGALVVVCIALGIAVLVRMVFGAELPAMFGRRGILSALAMLAILCPVITWPAARSGDPSEDPTAMLKRILLLMPALFVVVSAQRAMEPLLTPVGQSLIMWGAALLVLGVYWLCLRAYLSRADIR